MAELTPAQEQQLATYIQDMYRQWLPAVEAAVLGGNTRYGIPPDPAAITATTGMWRAEIQQLETQQLQPAAAAAYEEEDPQGQLDMSDAVMAAAAVATLFFLLAQVGEVQAALVTIVATAASVPEAVANIRSFLDPGAPHWVAKALQVAATEGDRWVQAATLVAGFALQRRDGIPRDKRWINRNDTLVRTTHVAAGGQVRPIGVPFTVGGYELMYPKDPAAPPQEVVNCRCTMRISRRG